MLVEDCPRLNATTTSLIGKVLPSSLESSTSDRQYLHGSRFVVEADHSPLKALLKSRDLTGWLARWALVVQSYDCEVR